MSCAMSPAATPLQSDIRALIQDHLDHCLEDVVGPLPRNQRASIDEFRKITKYL